MSTKHGLEELKSISKHRKKHRKKGPKMSTKLLTPATGRKMVSKIKIR